MLRVSDPRATRYSAHLRLTVCIFLLGRVLAGGTEALALGSGQEPTPRKGAPLPYTTATLS